MCGRVALFVILAIACLNGCAGTEPGHKANAETNQVAKHLRISKKRSVEFSYLLYLPRNYEANTSERWPLLLFLHGAGERGTNVWKVATHGPPRNVIEHPDFPFVVVSPQCAEGRIWAKEDLLVLLDDIMLKYRIDPKRVYLSGLSMGGYGTWDLGLSYPERFAAIVPICGGGEYITVLLSGREKSQALKKLGIWAFHGGKDPVVPLTESQRMVDALKKIGCDDVKLTVYPEAGHDSWTETYKNPELYEWLLKHQRSN